MTITTKPGLIRVTLKGKVYEANSLGYRIDGTSVPLEQMPLQVRYLMALRVSGEGLL